MMRSMFSLVLVAGVALAGAAVYVAQGYIGQTQSALDQERQLRALVGPIAQIYVVNKPKNYGEPLLREDVTLAYFPQNSLPEGTYNDEAALFPPNITEPRYILRQLEPNEPLMAVKITEPGQPAGLTGQLGTGMRAFAVKVDATSGVSGFVQPGDHVDIYWTGAVSGTEGELTRLIETSTRIVAVDQTAGANAGAVVARTVTVAATSQQVARLAQAQATGRLALALVGTGDETIPGMIEVNNRGLLGLQEQEVVEVETQKSCTVRQRQAGQVVEVTIPCTN